MGGSQNCCTIHTLINPSPWGWVGFQQRVGRLGSRRPGEQVLKVSGQFLGEFWMGMPPPPISNSGSSFELVAENPKKQYKFWEWSVFLGDEILIMNIK